MLPFDNLTGDASLDWLQSAAQRVIGAEVEGGRLVPFAAQDRRVARLERAHHMVHGYFDRRAGKLHFEIEFEDVARNKMAIAASGEGAPIAVLTGLARKLDPSARQYSTANDRALQAWAKGDYEQAIEIDADFGPAWVDWAQKLVSAGDPGRALQIADRGLARQTLRSPIDRTGLQILTAALRHDEASRVAALDQLAKLTPADPSPPLAIAATLMNQRMFRQAAQAYARAATVDPSNAQTRNLLGYAEALDGNLNAARQTFEAYGREPDQAENAIDSLGEAYFINGKFAEAEKSFIQAYQKNSSFLDGGTLRKAAYAHWLGGDLKGADAMMDQYWKGRAAAKDPVLVWRQASWLFETGRKVQAIGVFRQAPAQMAELVAKQIAIWSNYPGTPQNAAALKSSYERMDPLHDGLARTLYAAALLRAGQKDQARQLIGRWPLPDADDDLLGSLMYPEFLRLRQELQ